MIREKPAFISPGLVTFLFLVVLELLTIAALVALIANRAPALLIVGDVAGQYSSGGIAPALTCASLGTDILR